MQSEATRHSKKIRDSGGKVIARVRDRALAPVLQRSLAACNILRALVFIDDKRRMNTRALDALNSQQATIEAARKILLAERAKIDAKAELLAQTASLFVRALNGAGAAQARPDNDQRQGEQT